MSHSMNWSRDPAEQPRMNIRKEDKTEENQQNPEGSAGATQDRTQHPPDYASQALNTLLSKVRHNGPRAQEVKEPRHSPEPRITPEESQVEPAKPSRCLGIRERRAEPVSTRQF